MPKTKKDKNVPIGPCEPLEYLPFDERLHWRGAWMGRQRWSKNTLRKQEVVREIDWSEQPINFYLLERQEAGLRVVSERWSTNAQTVWCTKNIMQDSRLSRRRYDAGRQVATRGIAARPKGLASPVELGQIYSANLQIEGHCKDKNVEWLYLSSINAIASNSSVARNPIWMDGFWRFGLLLELRKTHNLLCVFKPFCFFSGLLHNWIMTGGKFWWAVQFHQQKNKSKKVKDV